MSVTRRHFVTGTAATAAALSWPMLTPTKVRGANDQIRTAVIGINGRGGNHIDAVQGVSGAKVAALCDVDKKVLGSRVEGFEKKYKMKTDGEQDFRRLLERKDIDAITIATPNHWHALLSIMAIESGKDVYVEKPVSHNVWEGRQLVNAARKNKRIVQTGTQSRASHGLHEIKKFLDAGELGKILFAVGTCYKPRQPIGKLDAPLVIPDNVDYDLWCGPAEKRDLFRPRLHYDWHWDFNTGNGDLGNQGIHQMDIARWMLGYQALSPKVMAIGTRAGYDDASDTPHTELVCHLYEPAPLYFDVRGMPGSKAKQNGKEWGNGMDNLMGMRIGVLIECEGGTMLVQSYTSGKAIDKEGKTIKPFNGGGDHMGNFFDCVRSRKHESLFADIEQGHLSSALCHTGNISYQLGSPATGDEISDRVKGNASFGEAWGRLSEHLKLNEVDLATKTAALGPWLEMDPKTERFTNNASANKLLSREYRKGYVVQNYA